jgi:hypothetical protein
VFAGRRKQAAYGRLIEGFDAVEMLARNFQRRDLAAREESAKLAE